MLNAAMEQGRIPFDLELKDSEDESKAFLGFSISVARNFKPEGAQYYPEDLLRCKAFGAKARFIAKYFQKGSNIIIQGEIHRDDDYEKDGETVHGQMYILVKEAYFVGPKTESSEESSKPAAKTTSTKAAAPAKKTPTANPLFGGGTGKKRPF